MSTPQICPICCREARKDWLTPQAKAHVECGVCGTFEITRSLNEWWRGVRTGNGGHLRGEDEILLPYLAAAIRQSRTMVTLGEVTWKSLAEDARNTPISVKIRRLLEWLGNNTETYGSWVLTDEPQVLPLVAARDDEELAFLLAHLENTAQIETGLVGAGSHPSGFPLQRRAARLTVGGWETLAPAVGESLGTCFVAMAFAPTLNDAFDNGILAALELDCGFTAVRVDRVEHNDDVTDRILASIRGAQFVVADFTLQRAGVYYEAGFARGLGREVVMCCRETDVDDLHFDTRNRNHVVWTDAADLRIKLRDRIRATIPGARQT